MKYFLLTVTFPFFSFLHFNTPCHASTPFAYLVEITHVCNGVCGSVEFALNGDPDSYTYYWTHGPATLRLDCLEPGTYTLVVIDMFGCVETYEVEILLLGDCTMTYQILPTFNPCYAMIVIEVFSGGNPLPESSLNVEWSDGDPSGLTRIVSLEYPNTYCVHITPVGGGAAGPCCDLEECIPIISNPKCSRTNRREVIVNELNKPENMEEQFVELLVIGDGECGNSFDLRGFIIDDNNGYLIPGNDFLTSNNTDNIGIDPGYLMFSDDSTWTAVPNGSLIIIHPGQAMGGRSTIPPDDPYDADQDGVYVLQAGDQELLWARSGTWNDFVQSYDYGGYIVPASWGIVQPSPYADGMQIRYPDASFSHGVSLGETPFSGENEFSLWVTDDGSMTYNIRFTGTDYLDKNHFTWGDEVPEIQSPGLSNSVENAAFISQLHDCPGERSTKNVSPPPNNNKTSKDNFEVYPNPFNDEIQLKFNSQMEGEAKVVIYSPSGQMMFHETLACPEGRNSLLLKTGEALGPGVFVLQFTFPSGEQENERIVKINSY